MRLVTLGVVLVAATLFLSGLGAAPFIDPPEGFQAEIAREMRAGRDFVTPQLNTVRHLEGPPLLPWLISISSSVGGFTPLAARVWPALAAIGLAVVTAHLGLLLGGQRVGLLAGLMVAANLGTFVFGRVATPDLLFVLCITAAYGGFVLAYLGRGRWPLAVGYGALGVAALAKDLLGALSPVPVIGIFFWLTRERPLRPWLPWWGVVLFCVIAMPWYALVELHHRGFLWSTLVDHHLLNLTRPRGLPEDVPLGSLPFLVVTVVALLPWALALPTGVARIVRASRQQAADRVWLLFAVWGGAVIAFFTIAPGRLAHDALPAFPALALIAARAWDDTIARAPGAVGPRTLLLPLVVVFAAVTAALAAVWAGLLPAPRSALTALDATTRTAGALSPEAAGATLAAFESVVRGATSVLLVGTVSLAVATWRRAATAGVAVTLATVLAFLPLVGNGMTDLARRRSARPIAEALIARMQPGDLVMHEGPVESSGSVLLQIAVPIAVVDGLPSSLAYGGTSPRERDVFWDAPRTRAAWAGPGRHFLISVAVAERSVVRALPAEQVHVLVDRGGRRLYSNRPDAQ